MPQSSFYTDGDPSTLAAVAPAAPASFYADPQAASNSAAQAAASAASAAASVQAAAGSASPLMDSTALVGTGIRWAREDHVHPSDTSRAPASFLQSGTGAVSRTVQDKARDWISVKDFGAVGDGVTNDTSAIAAAIAAVPYGGRLYFPTGSYLVSGSGSAIFTITQPVHILGAGAHGSTFIVDSAVPTSRDAILVLPANGSTTRGYSIRDIGFTSNSGFPCRDTIRIDTSQSNTTEIAEFDITGCYFAATGGGYSIHHLNGAGNANGGLFNSNIDKNLISGGIRLDLTGDSIRIRDNIISTANAGISGSQISGGGNLLIKGNNISGQAGGLVISQTLGMIVDGNEFEQQATNIETNNAVVDLTNTVGTNDHPILINNQFQANASTGNPTLLRLGQSTTGAVVENNRFGTPASYVPLVIAAGATVNYIGNNQWPGLGAANVTDGGTGTKYAQPGIPIMGTSGSVQIAAGSTNFVTPGLINATESLVFLTFPVAGIVSNLTVFSQGAPGAGQSYTYTFRDALADTALTCVISGAGANSASDLTHSVKVAAFDRWSIKVVASAGAAVTNVLFCFNFAASA